MQIYTVDIGTGTQDIYLYRSDLSIENGFKLVMPSPTMIVRQNIQQATLRGDTILLSGYTMGGGPTHWAAEKHIRAGYKIFATTEAARTFNDDLDWVQREMGILVVSEEEALSIPEAHRIIMQDFDYQSISSAFDSFGVSLSPAAVLGAIMDMVIRDRDRVIIVNIGNFHTLAILLGPAGIEGFFEHHTGLLDVIRLEKYLFALADGTLAREEIYNDYGHGALILDTAPDSLDAQDWKVAITGPRRAMMNTSDLPLDYTVPFGDMMLTGCFGLMNAIAEYVPELCEVIQQYLTNSTGGARTLGFRINGY